ncbi:epsin-2 isoform X2 [Microcaecilia unicolor]|uniref:Epsin-2 isoform X2 n=1 Tax=Microcaecilia unicolor TaxID=1415580 RepID=A0A6P7YMA1_9AMPH|nr:epsin-2 isoform X2 [Microcaecilia unicolor]
MTTSSIRRQMKNIVNNYSEAEIKVREATSNDPWGPSSSLMTEIADLTYNVVAFSEIMSMIWKRLNDHGKNWRHVYKALTLLDYLIKTGSERVAQQCKENIFAIQTLKDFQYIDRDGKDQGINVREKSKQLVALLKDDERLKGERAQALKTKERMAQVATGVGSTNQISFGRGSSQPNLSTSYSEHEYGKSGGSPASYHGSTSPRVSSELEQARPQTSGEEELQLQLALAMSREVAEQEERLRRGDDLRLQMALEESRKNTVKIPKKKKEAALLDLMDALPTSPPAVQKSESWGPSLVTNPAPTDPWEGAAVTPTASDPWQSFGAKTTASADPWGTADGSTTQSTSKNTDPWVSSPTSAGIKVAVDPWGSKVATMPGVSTGGSTSLDPFSSLNGTIKDDFSEFDSLRTSSKTPAESTLPSHHSGMTSPDLFDSQPVNMALSKQTSARKTPESFLGPNAALVNLDSLVTKPSQPIPSLNPFLIPGAAPAASPPVVNPFQVNQPQPLTLNQLRSSPMMGMSPAFDTVPTVSIEPMPHSSIAPLEVGLAQVPTMSNVAPMVRMGQGMNMMGSVSQPPHSTSVSPAAAHSVNTTNPFLL